MKKYFFLFLFSASLSFVCIAQNQSTIIKTQALEMTRALSSKNFSKFAEYIHPKLIELAGGRDSLIMRMDTANSIAAKFGAKIKKIIIGNPRPAIEHDGTLQTTLPQETTMATPLGDFAMESTLIAISSDGGKNWKFIDTSLYGADELKESLPVLSPKLEIPKPKGPRPVGQ